MLTIRGNQLKTFERAALDRFEDEMIAHSKDFSPRLCEVIGDRQLRVAVHSSIDRAMSYGLTNRGPIRLYIEMMFLFGSAFDTDPQYPRFGEILNDPADQMLRAHWIHENQLDYYEQVSGRDASNVHSALKSLRDFARQPLEISSGTFVSDMLQAMTGVFPEKVAYVGTENLEALIESGRAEAERHKFGTVRAQTLVVALMFAFGHGCTADALYPWIRRTLEDERITTPSNRAARLEKKALGWLDHVIAGNEQRIRA